MKISDSERKIITEFLQWNDKNGCYTDKNCKMEKCKPFGKRDVLKLFFNTINADFLNEQQDTNPLSFTFAEIIKIAKHKHVYFPTVLKLKILLENNSVKTYEKLIKML